MTLKSISAKIIPKIWNTTLACLIGLISVSAAMPAHAQIEEVRIGISQFDAEPLGIGIASRRADERGVALNGEVLFAEPEFLKWAFTPQPYINGTLNLSGDTSFGGAGLLWRQSFGDKFYGDFSFGLVLHTGETDLELEAGESFAAFLDRIDDQIAFGSRVLFREQLTIGYHINEKWAGEVFAQHLSNGSIFDPINEGVDLIGIGVARRF